MNSMDKEINEISPKAFIHMFGEAQKYNRRFCFILGSGASREGGIPTGVEMAKIWAEELKNKYEEKELKDLMDTNFDSLIEDALFIYANKHPLLVGHESLAGFINLNVDRPIVAKIHRSLYFHPYNRQKETHGLDQEWQETLKNAFMVYTPVVIGYAGGDQSLMEFLKDENVKMNGVYWCYWKKEKPSKEIVDLVKSKNGCLIPIEGFDYFMYMLSRRMGFENPDEEMRKVTEDRIERYNTQYDKFEKMIRTEVGQSPASNETLNEILIEMDTYNDEQIKEAKKERNVHNFTIMGRIYRREGKYEKAIEAYTAAIDLSPEDSINYYIRGDVYFDLKEYDRAVEDYSKFIELNPEDDDAYNSRGYCYRKLGNHDKAIKDNTKAIELNPEFETAYNNRGYTYLNMIEYPKALNDFTKAVEINSKFPNPYKHMGTLKYKCEEYDQALEYLNQAIDLRESYKDAYETRAKVYHALGDHEKAKKDEERAEALSDTEN